MDKEILLRIEIADFDIFYSQNYSIFKLFNLQNNVIKNYM